MSDRASAAVGGDSSAVPEPFELTGGTLCLDFTNTLGDRPRCESEHLTSYADLLRFSRQTGSLPAADLEGLRQLSAGCDACIEPIFRQTLDLREALYRIFSGMVRNETPSERDLAVLNRWLHKALRQLELEGIDASQGSQETHGPLRWRWAGPEQALDRPLWPVARSAAELLTSSEVDLVRECASETCSWLFIDRSRNKCRRWCDMSTCGNRAKARRHYRRTKRKA